jgi:uncharacterized membrane protein
MLLLSNIKKFFLLGFYIILPISITLYILKIILNFINIFVIFINQNFTFLSFFNIPQSEFITLLIIIILFGAIIHYTKLNNTIQKIEKKIIHHIPIINSIYNGIKKLIQIIKKEKTANQLNNQNKVVWIKLPKINIYSLGLMIGELEKRYSPDEKKYFSIFIPTTPNPMTGYYVIAAEGEFIFNSMTREEAISIIISGGIIRPE